MIMEPNKEYYQKVLNDFQVFQRDADTHIREMQTLLAAFSNTINQGIQMDPRKIDYIRERLPGKYLDLLDHAQSARILVQQAASVSEALKQLEAKEKAEEEAKAKELAQEAENKAKAETKAPEEKAVKTKKK